MLQKTSTETTDTPSPVPDRLGRLADFPGTPEQFWPLYLEAIRLAFDSVRSVLLARGEQPPWQALLQSPAEAGLSSDDARLLTRLAEQTLTDSPVVGQLPSGRSLLGIRLPVSPEPSTPRAVLCVWPGVDVPNGQGLLALAELAAEVPRHYQHNHRQARINPDQAGAHRLYDIIRLGMRLGEEQHFMQMAFALCNELSVRFAAERVALGWVTDRYVELVAISHIEKFDRKTTAARELVQAMEEALDQDTRISHPPVSGSRSINRAHEHYARKQGSGSVISIPVRTGHDRVAMVTLERQAGVPDESESFELELILGMIVRPLGDLHWRERSIPVRVRDGLGGFFRQFASPRHTGWKLAGITTLVLLLVLSLLPWPYRVDAGVTLRSRDLLFMPAPFDGYLEAVQVEIGDRVEPGQILVKLDTRDLLQEESGALADVARYGREAEKSQAVRQLAEMQIALARKQQAEARLALVRHQLQQAEVRAPQAGIVVEGELKKNLGSPLRKGDLLLKLAQTANLELELQIDQVDVHEVQPDMPGEFALVGHPEQRFALTIERVDPVATTREGHNVFLARARLGAGEQDGWRPGMGGNARIEVGERKLIWLLTHRTVRFLREFFWL